MEKLKARGGIMKRAQPESLYGPSSRVMNLNPITWG